VITDKFGTEKLFTYPINRQSFTSFQFRKPDLGINVARFEPILLYSPTSYFIFTAWLTWA